MSNEQSQQSSIAGGWLAIRWRRFVLAVTFLTRLPLPVTGEITGTDLRMSMGWYPGIGTLLGLLGWGIYAGGSELLTQTPAAVLTIIVLEMCTGALHLDGMMDTCDGMGSGAPRERALEIMKDSRVGAMGVFGAIATILLKVSALSAFTSVQAVIPMLIGWSAARAIPALDVVLFRYARTTGTGGMFNTERTPWGAVISLFTALALAWYIGNWGGLALAVICIGMTLMVQVFIARRLQGLTGDVYGMGIELAEVLALLVGCVMVQWTFI